ncbi:14538_t:CDS:2, partial [Cetraspora pellucida]
MSQENQSPNPRESASVRQNEPGFPFHEQSGDQPLLTPSARVLIPETPGASHRSYRSRPTSSNASASSPPKLSRRKSSFVPSEESEDSDEDSDDSKNSKKRAKRKSLKKRVSSYRSRSEDIDNDNEENTGNDDELTIKDRQEVINTMHPFGMPIWKSALYKKSRSVIRDANSALHSTPTAELYMYPGNILWAIVFGWELALVSFIVSLFLSITPCGGERYALVLRELSYYILWPFGKYVEKIDEWTEESDEYSVSMNHTDHHDSDSVIGNGNGIDIESNNPLLGRRTSTGYIRRFEREKHECFGFGIAEFVFYFWYFLVIAPLFLIVSALCWFSVIAIPMAKLTYVVSRHLRKHPLLIHFKSGSSMSSSSNRSSILLCTYKAIGLYYKYTYDGVNIIFINLMPIVVFAIIDNYIISEITSDPENHIITSAGFIFSIALVSVVPLSYFIGMAVASISAQSSAGLGAVVNATFGSIIEIILYSIALTQGEGKLAEGSIIGSLLCGVLLLPGLSMISGGLKRKEQKFNAKSAGVTSTMLIMAIIGALTPTLFYQTFAP